MLDELQVYTDGGSRGNPGRAAIAAVLYHDGKRILQHNEVIGIATNNQAEYKAVIKGLELAAQHCRGKVSFFLDSEIVAKQLRGEYSVASANLKKLFDDVKKREKLFEKVEYKHVKRTNEFIQEADKLVNEALDA